MAKERKLRKFQLLPDAAPHYEPNPEFDPELAEDEDNLRHIETMPGEVVKSYRPLDRLFVNKFKPLDGGEAGTTAGGDTHEHHEDPNADRPVTSVEDALVRRGDRFLDEDEVDDPKLKKLAKGQKTKASSADEEEDDSDSEELEDVTDDFEGASDGGLQVFKDSEGKYHVHEKGSKSALEGSKKGFTTKKKTQAFVHKNAT